MHAVSPTNGSCTTFQQYDTNKNNANGTKIVTCNLTQGFISDCLFHNLTQKALKNK